MIQPLSHTSTKITVPVTAQIASATISNNLKENITALVISPEENRTKNRSHSNTDNQVLLRENVSEFERKTTELEGMLKKTKLSNQPAEPSRIKNKTLNLGEIQNEVDAHKNIKQIIDSIAIVDLPRSYQCGLHCFVTYFSQSNKIMALIESLSTRLGDDLTHFKRGYDEDKKMYTVSLNLNSQFGKQGPNNFFPAKLFFEELQKAFDNTKTVEKYIIAASAAKFVQLWRFAPPQKNDKTVIGEIADTHKELIAIGNALTPYHSLEWEHEVYVVKKVNDHHI